MTSLQFEEDDCKCTPRILVYTMKTFEVDASFLELEYFKWIISSLILFLLWILITQISMIWINGHRISDEKTFLFRKQIINSCSIFTYIIIVKNKGWHLHFIKLNSSIFYVMSMTIEVNPACVLRVCSLTIKLLNV